MSARYATDAEHAALAVTAKNLNRLDADTAGALEARRAHLRELALHLAGQQPTLELLLERLSAFAPNLRHRPECPAENAGFLGAGFAQLSMLERLELCRMVCAEMGATLSPADFFERDEPIAPAARGVIAYLQNPFTDHAYRIFSTIMQRARSQYHDNYGAACEAVSSGSCAACILPIEHAQDGKLLGFYRLIDRYELKIVCTCDIAQQNGVASRFALLAKNCVFPLPGDAHHYLFELRITRSAGHSIGAVLAAIQLCGLSLRRVDSIPLAYAEGSFAYHAVCSTDALEKLTPLLLYLALDLPQYNPIGIYSHLSE